MNGMPARLEAVSTETVYQIGDDRLKPCYICPDPALTGELLDEANLRVLRERDALVEVTYGHWSWRRWIVAMLPEADADGVVDCLQNYPILDENVLAELEVERDEDE